MDIVGPANIKGMKRQRDPETELPDHAVNQEVQRQAGRIIFLLHILFVPGFKCIHLLWCNSALLYL